VPKTFERYNELDVYTDGGCRGNPGPSASGFVIMTADEQIVEEGGKFLGHTTNNQAEYQAVVLALEAAKKYGKPKLNVYLDSQLVVNQLNGIYRLKSKDLYPIHQRIKELAKEFPGVVFTHVMREYNSLADAQVNLVLDFEEHKNASK